MHGFAPADVMADEEGVSIMRQLGRNMARVVRANAAEPAAAPVERKFTHFIR